MADIYIFKRIEKKYRIGTLKKDALIKQCADWLIPDPHGKNTVCSLYLDTPDRLLIRNSLDAKVYKEKLRVRSYGTPNSESRVFFEIKKKFKGVVYKRRVSMTLDQTKDYIKNGVRPERSQIMSEIDYAMEFYRKPSPSMIVAYEREAYFVKGYPNLRITFDTNVRYRENDLFLEHGNDGKTILGNGEYILEIKTDGAMPLWLSHALSDCEILPSSFSKYGTAYRDSLLCENNNTKGEPEHACSL